MVPLVSLVVPIVVSAIFVFIASSVIHMVTGFHKNDLKPLPDEAGTMKALRSLNIPPGDYAMPLARSMKDMGSSEFLARMKEGPVALLTIRPIREPGMTANLVQWFIYSLVVSLFAGYVAGVALGPGAEYLRVFQIAGCVAFTGYALALPQNSIWWSKNWAATTRSMIDGLVYGLLTGGTFGWLWPR
ncbi:MAG TPA: hypothetical protein VFP85_17030 [Vicinamibacterales bacterium]|nr:hypothetical protein [Vicinamibacterales bacterium]